MIFILTLTRNVPTTDGFGVWNNILDLLAWFSLPAYIIPFWAGRFTARGSVESGKTGLATNFIISLIVFPIYLIFVLIAAASNILHVSQAQILPYILATLQLIESYLIVALEGILQMKRPQMIGYGSLALEVTKVLVGITLIPWLKLTGAVSVMVIASFIQIIFYLRFTISEFKVKTRWSYVREWLKVSFFNIFSLVGQKLPILNLLVLYIFSGDARGFYGAAYTISATVSYSSSLAFALYPRLLSKKRAEDVANSLRLVLMFAIPMAVGCIVLADSYVTILNEQFRAAGLVSIVLTLSILAGSMSTFFETVVYGMENVDEKAKIPIKALVKSRIFKLASLPYFYSLFTLPTLFFVLTFILKQPLESALFLTLIDLATGFVLLLLRYRLAKKSMQFDFPKKAVAKYCLASVFMIPLLILVPQPPRLFTAAIFTLLGAIVYFAVLCLIDKEAREIANSILKNIRAWRFG
jgi:hypothetical protein